MQDSDGTLATLSLRFQEAATDPNQWAAALQMLADLSGGHIAELIGFGARPFHYYCGAYDGVLEDFATARGGDLAVNSRVRIGLGAAELEVLDESAFTTEADCRRHGEYGAFIDRIDIPFICLTNLTKSADGSVGLSVARGRRQGNIEKRERRLFEMAAPHVRAAVRTSQALEGRTLALSRRILDSMNEAAFVLDRSGRVYAWTSAADHLLRRGLLGFKHRRLTLRSGEDAALQREIGLALAGGRLDGPAGEPVRAFDEGGLAFLLHVSPLPPSSQGLESDAAVLVVAKPPRRRDAEIAVLAGKLYDLTPAERGVAALMAAGKSANAIAEAQGIGVGTVRTHIRHILAKAHCPSQLAFAAALGQRL